MFGATYPTQFEPFCHSQAGRLSVRPKPQQLSARCFRSVRDSCCSAWWKITSVPMRCLPLGLENLNKLRPFAACSSPVRFR
jgi:hypothetical protein